MDMQTCLRQLLGAQLQKVQERPGRVLLVLQGLPAEAASLLPELLPGAAAPQRSYLNARGQLDLDALAAAKKQLLLEVLTADAELLWLYYEEFSLLLETMPELLGLLQRRTVILENNLFGRYYPLDLDPAVGRSLQRQVAGESGQEEEVPGAQVYSGAVCFGEERYAYAYIYRHDAAAVEVVGLYPREAVEPVAAEAAGGGIFVRSLDLLAAAAALQSGSWHSEELCLVVDGEADQAAAAPLAFLARQLGVAVELHRHNRFQDLAAQDADAYLPLLRRYWGEESCFRDIQFYRQPDESEEVVRLSQGHIVSDILAQCQRALAEEGDYGDIFITAPTGAGKSLLFQLPAIHLAQEQQAVTLVITPLIALMHDQVVKLTQEQGVEFATYINSDLPYEEREARLEGIRAGRYSLVYLSPELLQAHPLERLIGGRRLGLFVVDEAHLVTTWGREFRADYWFLGGYLERLRAPQQRRVPVLCLTATAVYLGAEDVVMDIQDSLGLRNCKLYLGNVRRTNISFCINRFPRDAGGAAGFELAKIDMTARRLREGLAQGRKMIIYCPYTRQVDQVYQELPPADQERVGCYHGKQNKQEKQDAYEQFRRGTYRGMLCTKAFGMGVDIKDIETVYHFAPTGNLADYVQEIGRVARDEAIQGVAQTDFSERDLKYVRMLQGMSGIRQYQLQEVLRKIQQIQQRKNRRNLLVSPEAFSYLFEEADLANKVKNSLLLLEKDLERYGFPVLVVRPRSMFTKNFVHVPLALREEFLRCFGEHAAVIPQEAKRVLPVRDGRNGDVHLYDGGAVYEVKMDKIWEQHFSHWSFGQFKRKFFEGELLANEAGEKLAPRIRVQLHYRDDFPRVVAQLGEKAEALVKALGDMKSRHAFFSKKDFGAAYASRLGAEGVGRDLPGALLELFVADLAKNTGWNQNSDRLRFIQARQDPKDGSLSYRVMNGSYLQLPAQLKRIAQRCRPAADGREYTAYVNANGGTARSEVVLLAMLLEVFGLATYEVTGGKNMEIFVRVNDPSRLRRLTQVPYKNGVLRGIEKKRQRSQAVLLAFLQRQCSDEERWELIEKYFLGRDEEVERHLGLGELNNEGGEKITTGGGNLASKGK